MKLFLVSFVLLLFCTLAQGAEYANNEIPMYNGRHTAAELEALRGRNAYERAVLAARSEEVVQLGWKYFSEGDISTAIKRFNQSWLLDGDNYEAYWGFALVYLLRDVDIENADRMFVKALSLEPDAGNFYVEYGRFTAENKPESPEEAIALFQKGLAIDPRIRDGYVGLILSYDKKKDVESAYHWYRQGKTHGVFSVDEVK